MKPSIISLISLVVIVLVLITIVRLGLNEGFASTGETNERGTFTMYYADWCPHCQTAKPLFKQFMGNGVITIDGRQVRARMVEEKQYKKGVDPDVKGYPTFIYSDAAGHTTEYNGPRSVDGWMEFLKSQILS